MGHLAWLIRHGLRHSPGPWEGNPAKVWQQVIDRWMAGPAPRRVIASALAATSTPEIAANLSEALDLLGTRTHEGRQAHRDAPGPDQRSA